MEAEYPIGCEDDYAPNVTDLAAAVPHALAVYLDAYDELVEAPEYVIDNLLGAATSVVAGERGLGKTSTLVPLLLCCTGLLNNYPLTSTIRRKVVYIAEDAGQVHRIISAMREDGMITASREEFHKWFKLVAAKRMQAEEIVKAVSAYKDLCTPNDKLDGGVYNAPPVVCIDTTNATIDLENISDNAEVSKAVATLRQAFHPIPLVLVGHVTKASRTDAKLVSFIGAGAWEADTQQTLYLVLEDKERYLVMGKKRFEPEVTEYQIESYVASFDAQDKLGNTVEIKCYYGIPRATTAEAKADAKEERSKEARANNWLVVQGRVMDYVRDNPKSGTRAIRNGVTGNTKLIGEVIGELAATGKLESTQVGKHPLYTVAIGNRQEPAAYGTHWNER